MSAPAAVAPTAPVAPAPAAAAWRRFGHRRAARAGLLILTLLYLTAAIAPLVCNQKPWYWQAPGADGMLTWSSPLWCEFFHPESTVDFLFNLVALAVPLGLAGRWLARRRPALRRARLAWALPLTCAVLMTGHALTTPYRLDSADYYLDHLQLTRAGVAHTAYFAPVAYGPTAQIVTEKLHPPSWADPQPRTDPDDRRIRWLGTDALGRDLFSRLVHGTRISLSIGFVSVGIAVIIGLFIGALAGYYGGWVDLVISRFIELVICFPTFFLILLVLSVVRHPGIYWIMLILGVTGWVGIARLVRGELFKLRELEFVAAARALGVGDPAIIRRHLLPNALGPVYVAVSFGVAGAVLQETGLSFLGIGVQPPTPSWGEALNQAREHIDTAWWLATFPGLAILCTVLAFNLVGDGLRDAFDPRTRSGAD